MPPVSFLNILLSECELPALYESRKPFILLCGYAAKINKIISRGGTKPPTTKKKKIHSQFYLSISSALQSAPYYYFTHAITIRRPLPATLHYGPDVITIPSPIMTKAAS